MHIPIPHNFRAIVVVIVALALVFIGVIIQEGKGRNDLAKKTGRIITLQDTLSGVFNLHPGKMRYLVIDGYRYPFEIFIGNDRGDFKPEYEQIDRLKVGDQITVYYYEDDNTNRDHLNRHARFIDLGSVNYYKAGNNMKPFSILIIIVMFLSIYYSYNLYKKGKIPY